MQIRGDIGPVRVERDDAGVPRVIAPDIISAYRGLGAVHATDRAVQMLLLRVLGQGRAASLLDPELVDVDVFFRKVGWLRVTDDDLAPLTDEARAMLDAYCEGVNAGLGGKVPWELRLAGVPFEPWTPADSILLSRMTGYLTLAQSQGEVERFVVELVQAGVPDEVLHALFPGLLDELDAELLREVTLPERLVPDTVRWAKGLSPQVASNNWVVSGAHTTSGKPILANDPHLETNRLPAVWSEVVLETPDRWAAGATMPGLPGVLIGRTPDVAWGVTYAFMDAIDSWIERCEDGKVRRGTEWVPLSKRTEVVEVKGGSSRTVTFYESEEHGVLDGDPHVKGTYLSTRWSADRGGARSFNAMPRMWAATSAEAGTAALGELESAWNWVFADKDGHIAYQMSGLCPRRREGAHGLLPLPGWDAKNDWQGYVSREELPRSIDPDDGVLVTANDDLNHLGEVAPITVPMGDWRARRIRELLDEGCAGGQKLDVDAMRRIQVDLYSEHAQAFLPLFTPHLGDSPAHRALAEWDLCYAPTSAGPTVFERVYFGFRDAALADVLGDEVVAFLAAETGLLIDFYANIDRLLLDEGSVLFRHTARETFIERALDDVVGLAPAPWGETQRITLSHIVFGGKLPRWLGFNRGPIPLPGGRASVQQGQVYMSAGRQTSFAPTFRMVTDLDENTIWTALCGGPSDRRFSRWYASGVESWQQGRLKPVGPREA